MKIYVCVYIYIYSRRAKVTCALRRRASISEENKKNEKYIYTYIYSRREEETCASRLRASISGVAAARQKSVTDPPHTKKREGGETRDLRLAAEGLHIRRCGYYSVGASSLDSSRQPLCKFQLTFKTKDKKTRDRWRQPLYMQVASQ